MRDATEGLAFAAWLRGGSTPAKLPIIGCEPDDDQIETKGNPYHDPVDGRFTFANGHRRTVGYWAMTDKGRKIIRLTGGGGVDRAGRARPELFPPDPYTIHTPQQALAHYMGGSGAERNCYLAKADLSDLTIKQFSEMDRLVAEGKPGVYPIADSRGASNGGLLGKARNLGPAATIGGLDLTADGALAIGRDGSYRFSGKVSAFQDAFDFNPRPGRSSVAEASTTVGRQLPGKPFWINVIGSKPLTIRGKRP